MGEKCWQVGSKEKEQTLSVESVGLDRRIWVLLEAFKGKMTFGEIEFMMTEIEALLSAD